MMLIRLAYLQQALQFTNDDGATVKKKQSGAINFRSLPIVALPVGNKAEPAGIYIKEQAPKKQVAQKENKTPPPAVNKPAPVVQEDPPPPSFKSLKNIREKVIQSESQNAAAAYETFTQQSLQKAWADFANETRQNKNLTTASAIEASKVVYTASDAFDVHSPTTFLSRFVEAEKQHIMDHLMKRFGNIYFRFNFLIDEAAADTVEVPKTQQEIFDEMAAENPNLRLLKDGLRLSFD